MAESKGCAEALRRVMRGAADSTNSAELPPSNMRDCVATVGLDFTSARHEAKFEKKLEIRTRTNSARPNFEFRIPGLLLGGARFGSGVGVLLGEALDAARRVHQLLLTGVKRVAVRADFDAQHVALDGGAGLKRIAAGAVHGHGMIVGMNTGFHDSPVVRGRSAPLAFLPQGLGENHLQAPKRSESRPYSGVARLR